MRNALTDRGPVVSFKRRDGSTPLPLQGLRHMVDAAVLALFDRLTAEAMDTPDASLMH